MFSCARDIFLLVFVSFSFFFFLFLFFATAILRVRRRRVKRVQRNIIVGRGGESGETLCIRPGVFFVLISAF